MINTNNILIFGYFIRLVNLQIFTTDFFNIKPQQNGSQLLVCVLVFRASHRGLAAGRTRHGSLPLVPPLHSVHRTVQGSLQDPLRHRAVAGVVHQEHGRGQTVLLILRFLLKGKSLLRSSS